MKQNNLRGSTSFDGQWVGSWIGKQPLIETGLLALCFHNDHGATKSRDSRVDKLVVVSIANKDSTPRSQDISLLPRS